MAGIRNGRPCRCLVAPVEALGAPRWIWGHNIPANVDGSRHPLVVS